MEDNTLGDVWCRYTNDVPDVFQDYQAVRNILREESCFVVQFHEDVTFGRLLQVLAFNGKHWEWHSRVSKIRIEYPFEAGSIRNLSCIHGQNSIFQRQNLVEVHFWAFLVDRFLDELYLIAETLNFVSTGLV